jgi:TonB-dependent receptor
MKANKGAVRLAVIQALACASGLALAVPTTALADPAKFDIAAQPLPKALQTFAEQAKMQLLYRYDLVSRATAHPVHGLLETHAALEELLLGTGLTAVYSGRDTATIRAAATLRKDPPAAGAAGAAARKAAADPADGPPRSREGHAAAAARDAASEPLAQIVVVGRRVAITNALKLEKNASTFVNVMSATDIGAFPASSASSAVQLLPGVLANRLQSNDDSTHPSGEATNVLIRGLPDVRTELNGRDALSADSGRGLNFNDISPELLSRIEVYKNATADMVEGGIAGTVNLVTRLPFDQRGPLLEGSVQGDYTTPADKISPVWSVLASDAWQTPFGRFGLLADYARSHVETRVDSVIMDKIDTYCSAGYGTPTQAIVNPDGSIPCTANPFGGTGWRFAPDGIRYSEVKYNRHRTGTALAAQYENDAHSVLATVQYTDSVYRNPWIENASHAILDGTYFGTPAFDPRSTSILAGSSPLAFGPDGMLQSGLITQPHGSWAGSYSANLQDDLNTGSAVAGVPFVNDCGPGFTCPSLRDGMYFQDESRYFNHGEGSRDVSGHLQWRITPRLHANFDAQYINSWVNNSDILVASGSMANYQYSVNGDGTPQVGLLPGSNVNYAPGGLSNPHNYWIPFIQGHLEDDGGGENAYRADFKYEIDPDHWLDSLQAGLRFANRHQTVQYSTFNWTPIAASWSCNGPGFNADNTAPGPYPSCAAGHPDFKGYGAGIWGTSNFDSFYDGSVYPNGGLVFLNDATVTDFPRIVSSLSGAATNSPISPGYVPLCDRTGNIAGGCFQPSEVEHLNERTKAAYVMLNFGGDRTYLFDGRLNVVGNVGVRVVRTEEVGNGNVEFPTSNSLQTLAPCSTPLSGGSVVNPSCYLTPSLLAFSNGGGAANTDSYSYTNWLPSFNVRLGLDPKDFIRFAYSKGLSRPDIGYLRNFVQISSPILDTQPDSPYVVYSSPTAPHTAANVTGYNFVFTADTGNTELRPQTADQFDLSFERYFGPASAFTVDLFYKKLSNTLDYGKFSRTFTNGGATENVEVTGPINHKDGGTLKGVEADFESYFHFVPRWLKGIGTQANYTFVDTSGIHNNNLIPATSGGGVGAVGAGVPAATGIVIDSHHLAGVSKNSFNVSALYERGPVGARLTYSWRSRYLTDNLDCCIGLPVFQKSAGFLDSSIHYAIDSHVEVSFDVANILNTVLVYQQQIFGDSSATPGAKPVYMDSAWSRSGRRYQLNIRAKF